MIHVTGGLWNLRLTSDNYNDSEKKVIFGQRMNAVMWQRQMSHDKNPGCLGYIGHYTTQVYRDYNKPNEIDDLSYWAQIRDAISAFLTALWRWFLISTVDEKLKALNFRSVKSIWHNMIWQHWTILQRNVDQQCIQSTCIIPTYRHLRLNLRSFKIMFSNCTKGFCVFSQYLNHLYH